MSSAKDPRNITDQSLSPPAKKRKAEYKTNSNSFSGNNSSVSYVIVKFYLLTHKRTSKDILFLFHFLSSVRTI